MQFGQPGFLAGLMLIIAVGWLLWRYRRWQQQTMLQWADPRFLRSVRAQRPPWQIALSDLCLWLALLCLVLALARPQWGAQQRKIGRRGLDIAVLLDISNSMKEKDVHPSRWQRAILELQAFSAKATGDRLALLAFAGEAGLQAPFTDDTTALRELAWHSKPGLFAEQGAGLTAALTRATALLKRRAQQSYARVIIVLSDGIPAQHQPQAIQAAQRAGADDIYLFIVGFLPSGKSGHLPAIAQAGKGHYVPLQSAGFGLQAITLAIQQLKRSDRAQRQQKKPIDRFSWFLAAAAIFLCLSRLILPR